MVGARRYQDARTRRAAGHFEEPSDDEQDRHAVGAELAASVGMGGSWEAIHDPYSGADVRVGPNAYQIRWTQYRTGFLMLYPPDAADATYLLVTGALPTYFLVGTILGARAKTDDYWTTTNPATNEPLQCPCYAIQQSRLLPVEAIPRTRDAYRAYLERPFLEPWESMTFDEYRRVRTVPQ